MAFSFQINEGHFLLESTEEMTLPDLVVISGKNGSGKSLLLKEMQHALLSGITSRYISTSIEPATSESIRYVETGFQPSGVEGNSIQEIDDDKQIRLNLLKYIRNGDYQDQSMNSLVRLVMKNLRYELSETTKLSNEIFFSLTDEELVAKFPLNLSLQEKVNVRGGFIAAVFENYLNKVSQYKITNYNSGRNITDEEIYVEIGSRPPWELINELFEFYGFNYRINKPIWSVHYSPIFTEKDTKNSIRFPDLSNGEKLLLTLILWAYDDTQKHNLSVMILDEFDAHLNPALSKAMMDILKNKIVDEFGIRVILTTHHPSTVAHAPDESLFWLERGKPISHSSKSEIIPILSDGIITVQPDNALQLVANELGTGDKPVLLVEGYTDKQLLETAWAKLNSEKTCPFVIADFFDCYAIINLLHRGDIFHKYPDRCFIGLIDFDDAYKHAEQRLKKGWKEPAVSNSNAVVLERNDSKGMISTLTIPAFRESYAGIEISGSKMTIEHLFEDEIIDGYCEEIKVPGGHKLLKFIDRKKSKFAERSKSLNSNYFAEFRTLFEHLETLI